MTTTGTSSGVSRKIAPKTGTVASSATNIAPKLYHFRGTPDAILRPMRQFSQLAELLGSYRKRLFLKLLLCTLLYVALLKIVADSAPLVWKDTVPFLQLAIVYSVLSYVVRTVYYSARHDLPTPGGLAIAALLFCGFYLFVVITSDELYLALVERSLTHSLAAAALATVAMALCYGWFRFGRIKRITPQSYELAFCCDILEKLLPEAAPGMRCDVQLNPFPAAWSEATVPRTGRKPAYFDCLLRCKLPLGPSRTFVLSVMHRRTSKGRRKHKGWKHKVKVKYDYRLEDLDNATIRAAEPDLKRSLNEITVSVGWGENPHGFEADLTTARPQAAAAQNSLTAVQTLQKITSMSDALPRKLLPHPQLVLEIIRTLCRTAA